MTLEEMEKRLKTLEDIAAIQKMHHQYIFWVDNHEWESVIECFSENAVVQIRNTGVHKGKEAVTKFYRESIAAWTPKDVGHLVGQPVIDVDGDIGKGHWLMYNFFPNKKIQWIQARFDCEYVRENGQWKFSSLKYTRPWPSTIHDYLIEGDA
jgi:hypothetical protein